MVCTGKALSLPLPRRYHTVQCYQDGVKIAAPVDESVNVRMVRTCILLLEFRTRKPESMLRSKIRIEISRTETCITLVPRQLVMTTTS